MKLVTMPFDRDQATRFVAQGIDCLLLGAKSLSLRCANYFTLEEIKKIAARKGGTKVFVLVNQFFFEQDLKRLESQLRRLALMPIDGIYFQDFAVVELSKKNNLKFDFVYHPETMVTSYGQFPFFLKNGIFRLVLSRELFKSEIALICKNKPKKMALEIQGHGFLYIMHSRWRMVSNFREYADLKIDARSRFFIHEAMRKYPNAIYEDEYGTHMFSGYELCSVKALNDLAGYGVDYLRIDNVLHGKEWCEAITLLYDGLVKSLRGGRKIDAKTIARAWDEARRICAPNEIALGFLGTVKDNLHLITKDETETV